jgi:transcriptional regulator NrdR family protein
MKCPRCGGDSKIEETRKGATRDLRRYRRCPDCRLRFTTIESLDASSRMVAKRLNQREPFSRDKVAKSITKAVVRDMPPADLNRIVDRVVEIILSEEAQPSGSSDPSGEELLPIEAELIGRTIIEVLRSDVRYHVVLARFALLFEASHGAFNDAETFLSWLDANKLARHAPKQTSEEPELVLKRDGTLAPFDNDKLQKSIRYSAKKKPSAAEEAADELFGDQILELVLSAVRYQRLVTSGQLATEIMRVLRPTSQDSIREGLTPGEQQLAYLRVASTAKNYTRVEDFAAEARGLLKAMHESDLQSDAPGAP